MPVYEWLKAGVTGSFGNTTEPCNYTSKFPDMEALIRPYFRGATLLESIWKSVEMMGQGLVVGEPLAKPFGNARSEVRNGTFYVKTNGLVPNRRYRLMVGDSEAGPLTLYRSDITVTELQYLTLEIPNAGNRFYKLVTEPCPGNRCE